ncbi:MAG: hypothetical protein M3P85_00370 [Actinomycetota bacterium]|nr:hypothetical protein [Actinomycetota bacterium]
MSAPITFGINCGPCSHVATATRRHGRWHFAIDDHDDPAVEKVLDALADDRRPLCRDLTRIASGLAGRGLPPEEALEWAATGAVDPDLRERVSYVPEAFRFEHVIQASLAGRGMIRLPGDHPYITLEEVDGWRAAGREPFAAYIEFSSGHRRLSGTGNGEAP